MSLIHLGYGILSSPPLIGRFIYNYGWSWMAPTISFKNNSNDIELQEPSRVKINNDKEIKRSECKELVSYIPINIEMPTPYDVIIKIITTTAVEVPLFVLKNLYNSPIPTTVALYALLPTEVWMVIGPRVLYYLPKLL